MGFIAIVGSGALGGAVAHALAVRDRVTEVRLIDPTIRSRAGKRSISSNRPLSTVSLQRSAGAESIESAVGADVIVIADAAAGNAEHSGEAGLGLLRTLTRAGSRAPIVCAGAAQADLIALAVSELRLPRHAVLGFRAVRARVRVARAHWHRARWLGSRSLACGSSASHRALRSWPGKKQRPTASPWRRRCRRTSSPGFKRGFLACGRRVRTPSHRRRGE